VQRHGHDDYHGLYFAACRWQFPAVEWRNSQELFTKIVLDRRRILRLLRLVDIQKHYHCLNRMLY